MAPEFGVDGRGTIGRPLFSRLSPFGPAHTETPLLEGETRRSSWRTVAAVACSLSFGNSHIRRTVTGSPHPAHTIFASESIAQMLTVLMTWGKTRNSDPKINPNAWP